MTFQLAKEATPWANVVSPIRCSVSNKYSEAALSPIITFYIRKNFVEENWPGDGWTHARFWYDPDTDPPTGQLEFSTSHGTKFHDSNFQWKVNFHGWPALGDMKFDTRTSCLITSVSDCSCSFQIAPLGYRHNHNTGLWEQKKP